MLFTPVLINKTTLSNRYVLPPMATAKSKDGTVSEELIQYYQKQAEKGFGLIILEHAYISREGMANFNQLSISKDEDILGLKKLRDALAPYPCKVLAQISHAGSSTSKRITNLDTISASAIPSISFSAKGTDIPLEMTKDDIKRIITLFTDAAIRAKKANFDGVEIHSAHGYLLNQFYSPLTNHRTDDFGSTLDGRIKLHLEIIHSIRKAVGDDFILAMRLGACDYMEGGSTVLDSIYAAKAFEQAGLDLLDISGGLNGYRKSDSTDFGYFKDASTKIKQELHIPLILTGGIKTIEQAETLLKENASDLIGIGRANLQI